jgi:hypothetical protein
VQWRRQLHRVEAERIILRTRAHDVQMLPAANCQLEQCTEKYYTTRLHCSAAPLLVPRLAALEARLVDLRLAVLLRLEPQALERVPVAAVLVRAEAANFLMRASKAARHLSASASRSGCSFGTGLAGRTPLLSCSEIVTYWPFSLSASVAALKAASLIHGVLPMPPFQEHRCFLSASYRIPAALTGVADHCRRCCCFVHSFSKYA